MRADHIRQHPRARPSLRGYGESLNSTVKQTLLAEQVRVIAYSLRRWLGLQVQVGLGPGLLSSSTSVPSQLPARGQEVNGLEHHDDSHAAGARGSGTIMIMTVPVPD